ncbi:MAG TPA: D-2-hydroxyacid dehydrogenase [Caldilineaceae bacterium]|nr:D-2-hydroxyacid dehydrogenase [Caldilineaceae bacterium]
MIVAEDVGDEQVGRLRAAFPQLDFRVCLDRESFIAAAPEAEIIFAKSYPPEAIRAARQLRWVQAGTAGVERILELLRSRDDGGRDVLLTNAHGAHGIPMAENILALMLAFAIRLPTLMQAQQERRDVSRQVRIDKFELEGQTLCVLGLGDIGGTLARKAQLLGMHVLGVRRSQAPFPYAHELFTPDRLAEALPRADHVALCLPLTSETQAIIGAAELRLMKPAAYIYNVGRGASIDPDALTTALREGWIAGAGLDVTCPEPLPPDSPLWAMPNVLLTQHTSGHSPFNAQRITDIFLENLGRYLRGEPLINRIDKTRGY